MKYILIILFFLINGCSNNSENKKQNEQIKNLKNDTQIMKNEIKEIKIDDLIFKEVNGKLKFNFQEKKILIFSNKNNLSNSQIQELKKNNYKFYIIENDELITFFKIRKFPTIIITDGKKETKYEGFVPNEVLKYEIKD